MLLNSQLIHPLGGSRMFLESITSLHELLSPSGTTYIFMSTILILKNAKCLSETTNLPSRSRSTLHFIV